jgi:hypothetical protein
MTGRHSAAARSIINRLLALSIGDAKTLSAVAPDARAFSIAAATSSPLVIR